MKKIIFSLLALMLVMAMIFTLVGCGGNGEEPAQEDDTPEVTDTEENGTDEEAEDEPSENDVPDLVYPGAEMTEVDGMAGYFTKDSVDDVTAYYEVGFPHYDIFDVDGIVYIEPPTEDEPMIILWPVDNGIIIEIEE